MNKKAKEFYTWLNACPFKVWKIQYDSHGKTTVSFIWDGDEPFKDSPNKAEFMT